ncbi:GILT-like protein 3 [Sabethes cyaneus]|uniref:GILT-like protein 3 n=1 Tax=Sabethes cyaneus TaxID=53552 RepID=UPI00237D8E50|nr:GILT-like protein 3 [Sabethes cyaneus]
MSPESTVRIFWLGIIFSLTVLAEDSQQSRLEGDGTTLNISSSSSGSVNDDDKLSVAVYYEALCPDSVSFITYQLVPAWGRYRDQMDLKLVPFGKAYIEDTTPPRYHCQHGRRECTLNILHGCVLDKLPFEKAFPVIGCLMQSMRSSFEKCIENNPEAKAEILACASGTEGAALFKRFSAETNRVAVPLSFVPTIEVNGKYDIFEQSEWLYRFDRTFRQEFEKKFLKTL